MSKSPTESDDSDDDQSSVGSNGSRNDLEAFK